MSTDSELRLLGRTTGFGLAAIAAATALAPGIALVRGTSGHDWYAASKLTAVEAAIAVGFDEFEPVVEYRRRDGRVVRMSRWRMDWNGEALVARDRIVETALHYGLLGAGIGGTVLCLTTLGAARLLPRGRRDRAAGPERAAYPYRSRATRNPVSGAVRRVAGRFRLGGGRVALLVVSDADFAEMVDPDGVVDLVQAAPEVGTATDAAGGKCTLPDAPPETPAAAPGDRVSAPVPGGNRPHRHGRWT